MEQKKMRTLKEYVDAYKKAMTSGGEMEKQVFSPEIWIYFKWTDDEEIEYPGEPKYLEKLEALRQTDPKLADIIVAGAEAVEGMMSFFQIG